MDDLFLVLLIIALGYAAYAYKKDKDSKHIKIAAILAVVGFVGVGLTYDDETEVNEEASEDQIEEVEVTETEAEEVEKEPETEEVAEETELPKELEGLRVNDVRDDATGNWKRVVTPSDVNMPDNALAYYDEYMEEGEVHYIISFATNTTTAISDIGAMMMVNITEYEDREEHSADTIGNGMLYGSYNVYTDSGEIEELEVE